MSKIYIKIDDDGFVEKISKNKFDKLINNQLLNEGGIESDDGTVYMCEGFELVEVNI